MAEEDGVKFTIRIVEFIKDMPGFIPEIHFIFDLLHFPGSNEKYNSEHNTQ
jgi:hypothetical protein